MSQDVSQLCLELNLSNEQCQVLHNKFPDYCKIEKTTETGKTKRKRSLWQQCIATRRKGKPFDPQAIKELAKEYRAGRCP